jgi:hypothetical protein
MLALAAEVLMVMLMVMALVTSLSQEAPVRQDASPDTRTWVGCVQAGTAPATYRLNLDGTPDTTTGTAGDAQNPMGRPFVHLVGEDSELDLTEHVGSRVEVTGRELSKEEAEQEAAKRPNRQEAAETAAGTGGESPGHFRYVRVTRIDALAGSCE